MTDRAILHAAISVLEGIHRVHHVPDLTPLNVCRQRQVLENRLCRPLASSGSWLSGEHFTLASWIGHSSLLTMRLAAAKIPVTRPRPGLSLSQPSQCLLSCAALQPSLPTLL